MEYKIQILKHTTQITKDNFKHVKIEQKVY